MSTKNTRVKYDLISKLSGRFNFQFRVITNLWIMNLPFLTFIRNSTQTHRHQTQGYHLWKLFVLYCPHVWPQCQLGVSPRYLPRFLWDKEFLNYFMQTKYLLISIWTLSCLIEGGVGLSQSFVNQWYIRVIWSVNRII